MSKIHVLKSNNNKSYNVVLHFNTPTGNNAVGLSWKLVGLGSKAIGSTSLEVGINTGEITQAEYDNIISGDVVEIVRNIKVDGQVTDNDINNLADILINEYKINMQSILKYFGHTL